MTTTENKMTEQHLTNYHDHSEWRRLDYLKLIDTPAQFTLHENPDVEWSEQGQYFLIRMNSPMDTWLKLQGL